MSPLVIDNFGSPIPLGPLIGSGGEGDVYEIDNRPGGYVAKLYKSPASSVKAEKLASMVRRSTSDLQKIAAWPLATLHSPISNATIGIVMRRVDGVREIHELYSPLQRSVQFPGADWRFLIHAARNCAGTFDTLHRANVVVGDVNQGNIFVDSRALVTLIDCDSFQFTENNQTYRCEVGVPHFTPPELQTAKFREVTRTTNHDSFGLAVLIFHLLFMGRHPFAGRYLGSDDMPIERAIREHRFAYGVGASRLQMQPPPNTITMVDVSPTISQLFERAFGSGSRPSPLEWWTALGDFEGQLCKCDDDPGHVYSRQRAKCPWCAIESNGGPNLFITVSIGSIGASGGQLDVAAVWAEVQGIVSPQLCVPVDTKTALKQVTPVPLPPGISVHQSMSRVVGWVALVSVALTPFFLFVTIVAICFSVIALAFCGWWLGLRLTSPYQRERSRRCDVLKYLRLELETIDRDYKASHRQHQERFLAKMADLKKCRDELRRLATSKGIQIQQLREDVRRQQYDDHLKQSLISSAKLNGIGPSRLYALESFGIETAYDVEKCGLDGIPGIGLQLSNLIEAWAQEVSLRFQFNPAKGVPKRVMQALDVKYHQKRVQAEKQLRRGPSELKQISAASQADGDRMRSRIAILRTRLCQAEADFAEVSRQGGLVSG